MPEVNFTVSERVNVFGVAPASTWGTYNWGAFRWGEGTAPLPLGLGLGIAEALGSSETVDPTYSFYFVIAEVQASLAELTDVFRLDAQGYYYVFPDRTTDVEEADFPSWTSGVASSVSWTAGGAPSTTWS